MTTAPDDTMYLIGHLFARLEAENAFVPADRPLWHDRVTSNPQRYLPLLTARLAARGKAATIADIMAMLPTGALPAQVTAEGEGCFALGYYHQRAGDRIGKPGRPRSQLEPRGIVTVRLPVTLIRLLEHATTNKTEFIEQLLRERLTPTATALGGEQ